MSASNGGLPADSVVTAFTVVSVQFPHDSEKINTFEFLEASKSVVSMIERFGKAFAPVRYDMNGNINKISEKYNENQEKHAYLEDLVLAERAEGGIVATDALQWLRRGLHFVVTFFQSIVDDDACEENLRPLLKKAYAETLEMYHGWMGTQLFGVISKFIPSRKDLLYNLALQKHNREEQVLRDMRVFTNKLSACVNKLINFYKVHDLESLNRSR